MQRSLKMGASTLSLTAAMSLFATAAFAQAAAPAPGDAVEEVVVTVLTTVTGAGRDSRRSEPASAVRGLACEHDPRRSGQHAVDGQLPELA
jgi:hypothetical protein